MKKIFALLALVGCGIALANADPQAAQKSRKGQFDDQYRHSCEFQRQ